MPEAGEQYTEQDPIKQHTTMGAPACVMPEAGEQYTKQHPIMGTPAWAHLHGMSCNILQ